VTGIHEPEVNVSEISNSNALPVAGQAISNSRVLISRTVSGGGRTVNDRVLVTLPCGVTMVMGPEMVSDGTTAVMRRSRLFVRALVKLALAPLNRTAVVPVKLVPRSVTFVPGNPLAGENGEPVKPGGGVGYQRIVNGPDWPEVKPFLPMTLMK